MKIHILKTWPQYFEVLKSRDKTFEVRKNDRDFKPGDDLILLEYMPEEDRHTGRELRATVSYFMGGTVENGIAADYCVLGLAGLHEVSPTVTAR